MKTDRLTIKIRAKKPKNVRNCESSVSFKLSIWSFCGYKSVANFADGRVQSPAQNRQATRSMATHGAGPLSRWSHSNDSRFPGNDAGHGSWKCYRGSRSVAET